MLVSLLLTAGARAQTAAPPAAPSPLIAESATEPPATTAPTPTPAATASPAAAVAPLPAVGPAGVAVPEAPPSVPGINGRKALAYVIPVRDQIAKPIFYIIRRGLKEAIEQRADIVILDMETPGGELGVTFEIMEALEKFPGATVTYVNKEALSAGAFISAVTEEIHFAPGGVIGAAAPVMSSGGDIDATMKLKIVSYLKARVRATSEGRGYRGQVISAMIDADYELKIDDQMIKPKGELLSLTATEASKTYGTPAVPLLAAGIARDVRELLTRKYGAGGFEVREFKVTWSERLAQYLTAFAPILMGLGMLALFVEFKTPGFGWPGITGIVLLGIVFLGHYVAGLSGHEPALVFGLGLLLVAVELFFLPGAVLPGLAGAAMILGSLIWAMADIWPNQPIRFTGDLFLGPVQNLGLALVVTVVAAAGLLRFLPRAWFWDKMVLATAVAADAQSADQPVALARDALVGAVGVAATGMFPSGEIEVAGRRYQARSELGHIAAGTPVVVTGRNDFGLIVERHPA